MVCEIEKYNDYYPSERQCVFAYFRNHIFFVDYMVKFPGFWLQGGPYNNP
ncbi:MAG: hypothetical protein ACD_65C00156G0002 [uncultured bacterium]|nr:MAG: hypothetical protein ACD_65C00156G0002 [uncultured bacterium]